MTIARPTDLSLELAISAYRWISHTPEKRAASDLVAYVSTVEELHSRLLEKAETDQQRAIAAEQIERFKEGYRRHQHELWAADSRTASSFITGPANFPVARNRKRMDIADKRRQEFCRWQERAETAALAAVLAARNPEQVQQDAWAVLQREIARDIGIIKAIDAGEQPYTRGAFVTSIAGRLERIAAKGQSSLLRQALAFVSEQQAAMRKPVFTAVHSVWQLEQTADEVSAEQLPTGEQPIAVTDEARIVTNHDADRVQIFFASIPDAAKREALKRSGWKWSPRNQAWQRKVTDNAIYSAKKLLGVPSP